MSDRYGEDVLAAGWRDRGKKVVSEVAAEPGLVVERADGFVGAVVGLSKGLLELEDRHGKVRIFPVTDSYLIDGEPVTLVPPKAAPSTAGRTASGSTAAPLARARVARGSRLYVEGRHDAELIEKVWGADLRVEGVVVELLDGVDNLTAALTEFEPGPGRRAGVLVDHLVPGSKESRITAEVTNLHVLVLGHPYVDVWQGVRPQRLGLENWPEIPRGVEWKHGICDALGWPHDAAADVAAAWQRILGTVRGYGDLEPTLLGRVEELIDFVTSED
ncbi:MAG: DUF3097 domain-containing protein [Pseudolysinimonas sp.]